MDRWRRSAQGPSELLRKTEAVELWPRELWLSASASTLYFPSGIFAVLLLSAVPVRRRHRQAKAMSTRQAGLGRWLFSRAGPKAQFAWRISQRPPSPARSREADRIGDILLEVRSPSHSAMLDRMEGNVCCDLDPPDAVLR
jgi:hypothetical protein